MLSQDITEYILSFLDVPEIQRCVLAAIFPATTTELNHPPDMELLFHHYTRLIQKKRVRWAQQRIKKHATLVLGPCLVGDCENERLTIIDLTGPVSSNHVLSPYCSCCTRSFQILPWNMGDMFLS